MNFTATLICIFLGGALGATSRALLSDKFDNKSEFKFPYGTLAANALASALLGVLIGVFARWNVSYYAQYFLDFGFCATLSTFSSLAWQIANMLREKRYGVAFLYATITFVVGVLLFLGSEYFVFICIF